MIEQLLTYTDPVNAALLVLLWWRLEKHVHRINRLEKKILAEGVDNE